MTVIFQSMYYSRILNMQKLTVQKSFFLFGPRSTGKTTLLREQFKPGSIINLLRSAEFLPLAEKPSSVADRAREPSFKILELSVVSCE